MSTHAMLGCVCKDGKIRAMWTSHDGYPSAVVPELNDITTEEQFMERWEESIAYPMADNDYDKYFPFEYPVREEFIGKYGEPMVFDTIEQFIKSQDFVDYRYLLKGSEWYIGHRWHYNSGYLYRVDTGFRVKKAREEEYTEGTWIPLKDMMPSRTVIEYGFNESAYLKYLFEHDHDYFLNNYIGLKNDEEAKKMIDEAQKF